MLCPLCKSSDNSLFAEDANRSYLRCNNCALICTPSKHFLSLTDEQERYDLHDNNFDNSGYKKYLSKVIADAIELGVSFDKGRRVLDFGAGKEFVLTRLLQEQGVDCTPHDPLYSFSAKEDALFDTIIACEVIEHLQEPMKELQWMNLHMKSGSKLYIRTGLTDEVANFEKWWYRSDLTHIIFFHSETMHYIAKELHWELLALKQPDIILFKKL